MLSLTGGTPTSELQFVNAPLSGPQYEPDAAVVVASPMVYPAAQAAPAQPGCTPPGSRSSHRRNSRAPGAEGP
jgi:hypothetical protein